MTFCIDIQFDGPTPRLELSDGTEIDATRENINRAVTAYVQECRRNGFDPAPDPSWFWDKHRDTTHIALSQPFAPHYRYSTLCGLFLRSGPTQEVLPLVATPALILQKRPCGNCLRIRRSRDKHE